MAYRALEIQIAIQTALNADVPLTALIPGSRNIYDIVPNNVQMPYLTYDSTIDIDASTKTEEGQETTVNISSWSTDKGKEESHDLLATIYEVLHDNELAMSGGTMVSLMYKSSRVLQDPDEVTFHGVMTFKVITQD